MSVFGDNKSLIVPDYIEPILGWRRWHLRCGELVSTGREWRWTPDRFGIQARCMRFTGLWGMTTRNSRNCKEPPNPNCSCGFYAAKSWSWLGNYFGDLFNAVHEDATFVDGIVAMWGKIIEAEFGYRAEYCKPIALILPPQVKQMLRPDYWDTDIIFPSNYNTYVAALNCDDPYVALKVLTQPYTTETDKQWANSPQLDPSRFYVHWTGKTV